ncbi:MAG: DUF433 domain-containing protein [Candidatus Kariarchaeaceae archaeon]
MWWKPCIEGTSLRVSIILEWLESGKTFDEILEAYDFLTKDDIKAVIQYARIIIDGEDVIPLNVVT